MSCHPGTPCYNSTVVDPCVAASSSSCEGVLYYGPALPNTGIDNLDNLCLAFQKVDAAISNFSAAGVTASNGLNKVGNDVRLGGSLTQATVINVNGQSLSITNLQTEVGPPDFVITQNTAGVLKKFVLTSAGQAITLSNNVGLVWTNPGQTNLSTLYNTTINNATLSVAVGGAVPTAASVWKTKSLVEVLDTILFPLRLPTYTIPTVTMTFSPTPPAYNEIGSSVSITATGVGNKWDAGAFTSLSIAKTVNGGASIITIYPTLTATTGAVFGTEFGFADPNSPNILYTSPTYLENLVIPAPVGTSSTVTYQFSGLYNQGLPKLRSDNTNDTRPFGFGINNPQAAGTAIGGIETFVGIYPYFWGTSPTPPTTATIASAIVGGTANKVLLPAGGTISIPFNNGTAQYLWVAHAAAFTSKTKWFVTALNNGNIGLPTDLFGAIQTALVNSPNAYWSSISFKMYISNYTTSVIGNLELRNI
jgi:hypothetical protein